MNYLNQNRDEKTMVSPEHNWKIVPQVHNNKAIENIHNKLLCQ